MVLLVYLLSVWWMFAVLVLLFGIIFLPAIIFGAVMLGYVTLLMCLPLLLYLIALFDSLRHGHCLRQPVSHRLCALSGLEKALAHLPAGCHVPALSAVGGDGNHHGKDAERIINTNAPANGEKFRLPGRCFYFIGLADRIVIVQLCQFLLVFLQRLGGFRILYLGAFLIAVVLNALLVQPEEPVSRR